MIDTEQPMHLFVSDPFAKGCLPLPEKAKHDLSPTLFFASFLFLRTFLPGLGSHAGEGRLSGQTELMYDVQSVLLFSGFLSHALLPRPFPGRRFRR